MAAAASAAADTDERGFLSVILENDSYALSGRDEHYTNGNMAIYAFPRGDRPEWLEWLGRAAPAAADVEYAVGAGQNIYTPEHWARQGPVRDDRPFAGWLYGEVAATARAGGVEDLFAVSVGVVGPAALGEATQRLIHTVTGDRQPKGWRHQLDNEPALALRFRRSRFTPLADGGGGALDLVSRHGLTVGNVVSEAGFGATLRFGSALFGRDAPRRLQPGISGDAARFDARPGRFDWFVFGGVSGRAVFRNLFLDGNTFGKRLPIDRKVFVLDRDAGVSFVFGNFPRPFMVTMSMVWRGKEFHGQRGSDEYGSVQVSTRF